MFEYLFVKVRDSQVANVNGENVSGEIVWDFANRAGTDRWELMEVIVGSNPDFYTLIFKRQVEYDTTSRLIPTG